MSDYLKQVAARRAKIALRLEEQRQQAAENAAELQEAGALQKVQAYSDPNTGEVYYLPDEGKSRKRRSRSSSSSSSSGSRVSFSVRDARDLLWDLQNLKRNFEDRVNTETKRLSKYFADKLGLKFKDADGRITQAGLVINMWLDTSGVPKGVPADQTRSYERGRRSSFEAFIKDALTQGGARGVQVTNTPHGVKVTFTIY